jgi:pSer/pThr/pTyr-binding forkhead associated (FHA) protein
VIQFKLLSGKMAGNAWVARRFPVRIGRASSCDWRSEDDGVWDRHLQLDFRPAQGVVLKTQSNALARINGQPVDEAVLRNGDVIEFGSLKAQFWLSETRQSGFRLREGLTWAAIAAISLGQVALVYWLLQ